MYIATDKIKALPRQFHINGHWVAVGGEIVRNGGEIIREASQGEYKQIFDLFNQKGIEGYIIEIEQIEEVKSIIKDVRNTKSNSKNNRRRKLN